MNHKHIAGDRRRELLAMKYELMRSSPDQGICDPFFGQRLLLCLSFLYVDNTLLGLGERPSSLAGFRFTTLSAGPARSAPGYCLGPSPILIDELPMVYDHEYSNLQ